MIWGRLCILTNQREARKRNARPAERRLIAPQTWHHFPPGSDWRAETGQYRLRSIAHATVGQIRRLSAARVILMNYQLTFDI